MWLVALVAVLGTFVGVPLAMWAAGVMTIEPVDGEDGETDYLVTFTFRPW